MPEYQIPKITKEQLQKLNVSQIKKLIQGHNLQFKISGYSKLKKAELIEKVLMWSEKIIEIGEQSLEKVVPHIKPTSKNIKKKLTKMTSKLAPELQKPLYKKGVEKGAKKQFQKKYGGAEDKDEAPVGYIGPVGKRHRKLSEAGKKAKAQAPKPRAKKKPPRRVRKQPERLSL